MQKRSDLSMSRSTKSVNPQQLLIGFEHLREDSGEEGEMDKFSKLEVSCLNP
jgi:hypothetical protein